MVDESENIFDTCVPTASNLAIILFAIIKGILILRGELIRIIRNIISIVQHPRNTFDPQKYPMIILQIYI